MKRAIAITAATAALLATQPVEAYTGSDLAVGILGGIIFGAAVTQPRPPVVYAPLPPVYYPAPPVIYNPPSVIYSPAPIPCYNRPAPVYDSWGRHIGWQEIRVCQ